MTETNDFTDWRECLPFLRRRVPASCLHWLLDKASLTARLQRHCPPGQFSVYLLRESYAYASLSEAELLGIQAGTRLRVREVQLRCGTTPLVYARSLIPLTSLVGRLRRLNFQGSKSLGAALFKDPSVKRGPIQIVACAAARIPGASQGRVWGRRSVFYVAGYPLLVSEFYLPQLIEPKR